MQNEGFSKMQLIEFENYLKKNQIAFDSMESITSTLQEFESFLSTLGKTVENCGYDDLFFYASKLIMQDKSHFDIYVYILRYSRFIGNMALNIACMEALDGEEMIRNFSQRLEEIHGTSIRDLVFKDINIPPIGIHPKERPKTILKLIDRLEEQVGTEHAISFLNKGLRDRYIDWYESSRKSYLKAGNFDNYLKVKKQAFYDTLNKHLADGTLFYTQEIDEDVMDYVKAHPTIESGIREGNILHTSKIPYMTKQFLEARRNNDSKKMKYFFCHNPWFREAILDDTQTVNPIACQISCGYYKDFWEGVLKHPVKVELTGSLIQGDESCTFNIHLPVLA